MDNHVWELIKSYLLYDRNYEHVYVYRIIETAYTNIHERYTEIEKAVLSSDDIETCYVLTETFLKWGKTLYATTLNCFTPRVILKYGIISQHDRIIHSGWDIWHNDDGEDLITVLEYKYKCIVQTCVITIKTLLKNKMIINTSLIDRYNQFDNCVKQYTYESTREIFDTILDLLNINKHTVLYVFNRTSNRERYYIIQCNKNDIKLNVSILFQKHGEDIELIYKAKIPTSASVVSYIDEHYLNDVLREFVLPSYYNLEIAYSIVTLKAPLIKSDLIKLIDIFIYDYKIKYQHKEKMKMICSNISLNILY